MGIDLDNVDLSNKHMVSVGAGDQLMFLLPPVRPMSKEQALVTAAWLVALADDDNQFQAIYEKVCNL